MLPFLDRTRELARLQRALDAPGDALVCVHGRRRLGKSRLIREAVTGRGAVMYVGDDRDGSVQREAFAREIARVVPGFAGVVYPGWQQLLERFWADAPAGVPLVIDELPALVTAAPELPSLLQKLVDQVSGRRRKVILCGSSQRMMHGLVLDQSAPLYGRARELLRIEPLGLTWLPGALDTRDPADAILRYACWGGVPRYWELAAQFSTHADALRELVLDPLGVLHREPDHLLRDELDDTARASSILVLLGQGCRRLSEIAGRLERPATALTRPLARLVELGFVTREIPFAASARDGKRTLYQVADPFLRAWFRLVEPNRSRLGAGLLEVVERDVERGLPMHVASVWEDLARRSVPFVRPSGDVRFGPAARLWGRGRDGAQYEIDVVAEAVDDPGHVLVGEVKTRARAEEIPRLEAALRAKAERAPELSGKRIDVALWILNPGQPGRGRAARATASAPAAPRVLGPSEVVAALA